ncbi:alpha/beta hydrolase [Streptomyces sp. NPDC048385]|uniref:alpha/beta hydrolase n=1 Tax=unclassified Streptomyces TaxID=2593676 RepID=UPI0034443CDF
MTDVHPLPERLARHAARGLGRLPTAVKRAIAGRPVTVDGQVMDLDAQVGMRVLGLAVSKTFESLPLAEGRAQIVSEAWIFGDELPVEEIRDLTIPTREGGIAARLYRPADVRRPSAALVYFHGGGWVLGDLRTSDAVARFLARHASLTVIAVDYRLAPENPFPAAVDDALAAFAHVVEHAEEYGVDPAAVGVGGESAGGNLAAVVALETARRAREAGSSAAATPVPAMQLLLMPVTDLSRKHRSYELFGTGLFLTEAQMDWYKAHYLPDPELATDPRVSPLLAEDVHDVAPAYVVVAGFDVLRDEGEAYAHKLRDAGVPAVLRRHGGITHSMVNATGVGSAARTVLLEVAGALRMGLTSRTGLTTPEGKAR